MKKELEKILGGLQNLAFLEVDRDLNILDYSPGLQRFAEHPGLVRSGTDSRLYFPELIGFEDPLTAVLNGEQEQFELMAIYRETPNGNPLYFNFYALSTTDARLTDTQTNNNLIIFFQDVTEQNVLERKYVQITNELTLVNQNLSAYKKYLQYIIKYMADIVFVTNGMGKIKECNQVAQNLLEASEEDLRNQRIHQVFKEIKLFPGILNNLENLSDQILFNDVEVNYPKKSGGTLTILFNCSVISIDDDERTFVYIGRDITERKKVEKEIYIALQKEREINQLKSNFFAMTNQEFRAPLTVILSSVELLEFNRQKASDPQSLKSIHQIKQSVESLLDFLDTMLLMSKGEKKKE